LVVVLGASNVALGLPWLVQAAVRSEPGGERDLLVAGGHGRSYGLATRVLGRSLPGLLQCGLWPALEQLGRDRACSVVLTDLGNDLMYGVEPERLVDWVRTCVERLPDEARVSVVGPPIPSLSLLSPLRFVVLRSLLFPGRRVALAALRSALERLASGLQTLAAERDLALIEPPAGWYGLDPIHVRRRSRGEAWRRWLGRDEPVDGGVVMAEPLGLGDRWRVVSARPESWRLFGAACGSRQPCRRLGDGSRLWLY
jgi:hypothetical protein